MLEKTGIPSAEQIEEIFPSEERLSKGPVAVFECYESIPCNPCAMSCPQGAVLPFADLNDLPMLNESKCNGCGLCIMKCPGLAVMAVDTTKDENKALVKLPYEFSPLPEKGQIITALDRTGEPVGVAEVVQIIQPANKTTVVIILIDKSLLKIVRNIRVEAPASNIACRCSDITVDEIRNYIKQGHRTVDEIKRVSRLGMGPCQGRTCIPLVMRELSNMLGVPADEITPATYRPIVTSIKFGDVAKYFDSDEEGL